MEESGRKARETYRLLERQIAGLADEESWYVPLLANAASAIYEALPDLNWAGFYLMRNDQLVLGPFQGKPACIHIPLGKGVCGAAAAKDRTVRVENVHEFPGHIACDAASNSEIVIPFHWEGRVACVLDIDSPTLARFTPADQTGLEAVVRAIEAHIRF